MINYYDSADGVSWKGDGVSVIGDGVSFINRIFFISFLIHAQNKGFLMITLHKT
jgi:hypothetical protein